MADADIFRVDIANTSHGKVTLALAGELDMSSTAQFANVLRDVTARAPSELTIDAARLTYCDSSGIKQFAHASELCLANDVSLRIIGVQAIVRRVLQVSGLDTTLPIEE